MVEKSFHTYMYMRLFRSKRFGCLQYLQYTEISFYCRCLFVYVHALCQFTVRKHEFQYDTTVHFQLKDTPPYQCRKLRSCRIKSGTVHQRCSASREVWLADGWGSGYVGQCAANRHLPLIWKTVRVREINRMYKTSSHNWKNCKLSY